MDLNKVSIKDIVDYCKASFSLWGTPNVKEIHLGSNIKLNEKVRGLIKEIEENSIALLKVRKNNLIEERYLVKQDVYDLYMDDTIILVVEKWIKNKDYSTYYNDNFDDIAKVVDPLLTKGVSIDKATDDENKLDVLSFYIAHLSMRQVLADHVLREVYES